MLFQFELLTQTQNATALGRRLPPPCEVHTFASLWTVWVLQCEQNLRIESLSVVVFLFFVLV